MSIQDRLKKLEKKAAIVDEEIILAVGPYDDGSWHLSIRWPNGKYEENILSAEEWEKHVAEYKGEVRTLG